MILVSLSVVNSYDLCLSVAFDAIVSMLVIQVNQMPISQESNTGIASHSLSPFTLKSLSLSLSLLLFNLKSLSLMSIRISWWISLCLFCQVSLAGTPMKLETRIK